MSFAAFGEGYAMISAVVATGVAVGMIGLGVWIINRPVTQTNPNPERSGWILIAIAVAAILVSWMWVLLTMHSKTAATLSGVSAIAHIV